MPAVARELCASHCFAGPPIVREGRAEIQGGSFCAILARGLVCSLFADLAGSSMLACSLNQILNIQGVLNGNSKADMVLNIDAVIGVDAVGVAEAEARGNWRLSLNANIAGNSAVVLTGRAYVEGMGLPIRVDKPRETSGQIPIPKQ